MTPIQIEILGTFAVAAMLVCYAAEDRDPRFTLAFAAACLASATYAGLIGSWPFLVIEVLWAGIALRRFRGRRAVRAAR
jgi:hypothetical protein